MNEISTYLQRLEPQTQTIIQWSQSTLLLTSYLCDALPPIDYISSVRAIVTTKTRVLTLENADEVHILPGGRLEAGETCDQSLVREVAEETGWRIEIHSQLGVRHYHHLTPKPHAYRYPYPDFVHVIYRAYPLVFDQRLRTLDDYELKASLRLVDEVTTLPITSDQMTFLYAAQKV
jgi:ADP-ribose pyrophosphatase YjhB (NUDIX family)